MLNKLYSRLAQKKVAMIAPLNCKAMEVKGATSFCQNKLISCPYCNRTMPSAVRNRAPKKDVCNVNLIKEQLS